MQMGKGDPRHIGDVGTSSLLNDLFGSRLLSIFDMDKIGHIQLGRFINYFLGTNAFLRSQNPLAYKSKKAFGGCGHIISGIVGIFKSHPKKFVMQLSQSRPFKLSSFSPCYSTKVCRQIFGVQTLSLQEVCGLLFPKKFRSCYFDVEVNVMADEIVRLCYIVLKCLKDFYQVVSLF